MPKYFMRGTKHESFERMMMSPFRREREEDVHETYKRECKNRERSEAKNVIPCDTE